MHDWSAGKRPLILVFHPAHAPVEPAGGPILLAEPVHVGANVSRRARQVQQVVEQLGEVQALDFAGDKCQKAN